MDPEDLKMMVESVTRAVSNKLYLEVQLAYEHVRDKYLLELDGIASDHTAEFKPMSDVEIEEAVSAYFEIDGKLQYREVTIDSIGKNIGNDVGKNIGKCASPKTLAYREFFENHYKEMARGNYKGVIELAAKNGLNIPFGTATSWLLRAKTLVAAESAK